jgi:hypothetical protein
MKSMFHEGSRALQDRFDTRGLADRIGSRVGVMLTAPRQLHPTNEQRDAGMAFGAVEIGYTTLDKLAEHLRGMQ